MAIAKRPWENETEFCGGRYREEDEQAKRHAIFDLCLAAEKAAFFLEADAEVVNHLTEARRFASKIRRDAPRMEITK